MRYENSLTSNVQDYIANTLAKKVSAAQERLEIASAARDVRSYLCDPTTLNTPDFVIRRFVQANHQELLPKNVNIPNLLEGCNIPWDKEILDFLAKALTALSKEYGTNISKKEWDRYLSGTGANRKRAFQIAFTLKMDVDSTIDQLLAFDMEGYTVRYPLDLICLFCQKVPGTYSWSDVEWMLDDFNKRTTGGYTPTEDEANQIVLDLYKLFTKSTSVECLSVHLSEYLASRLNELNNYCESAKKSIMLQLVNRMSTQYDRQKDVCDQGPLIDSKSEQIVWSSIVHNKNDIFPNGLDIADLLYVPIEKWDTARKEEVLKALEKYAKKRHVSISSNAWEKYIKGKPTTSRNKAFMLAFALRLNIDTTLQLLRGLQLGECSIDNPLDVVCLFCQSKQEWYCWANVETIMNRVETVLKTGNHKDTPVTLNTIQPSANMTHQIAAKLEEIFEKSLPETDAKCELIDYMVEHNSEFPRFKTTTVEPYLPGYSLSRMEKFLRLAMYLHILFPCYSLEEEIEPSENEEDVDLKDWGPGKTTIVQVQVDENGIPKLSSLMRSAFFNSEWSDIVWPKNEKMNNTLEAFGNNMRILCQNYEQHLDAIDRLRDKEDSVRFFERRDALLFIYFLINGYIKLGNSSEEEAQKAFEVIDDMLNSGDDFDYAIAEALEKAEYVFQYSEDENQVTNRFQSLIECFDLILTQMGYTNLYLPARFDRFVVLALLSATPDELTPLIMCQDELDYYESDF